MFDTLIHKHLRVPYLLSVHVDQKVKQARATVLLLHGIGDSGAAWDTVVAELPGDIRVISVDLLGFGQSPAPRWLKYNIRVQANSVIATLLGRRIRHPLIIVGHSMGSLVAIEIAKRYPLLVRSLVLCSPPLYSDEERRRLLPDPNQLLRTIYRILIDNPLKVATLAALVSKLKVAGRSFHITRDNVDVFMSALESSIVDQTALLDVQKVRRPIRMIYGVFDPLVIKANLKTVAINSTYANLTTVRAGHELNGTYAAAIVAAVDSVTGQQ